jgi:tetratricopeptide (TPR) repeat protein
VLLTLAGGLYATYVQKLEAERQRALAQKRFDLSRALVNDVLFDFQDELADVPGTLDARKHLVGRAKVYLAKVAEDALDDPGLMVDLSRAERRLGDIAGNPEKPNLGDTQGALRQYQRALELAQRALRGRPDDREVQSAVASSLHSVGSYYYWNDDLSSAQKYFEQEIPMLESLLKAKPAPELQRRLSSAILSLGDVYYWSSKLELALRYYDRACTPIFADKDTSLSAQDAKGVCHQRRADALAWLDRYAEAEEAIAQAVAIYKPMYEARPDRLERAHGYSISLNKQGEIYAWQEKYDLAFAAFSESLRVVERAYAADPSDLRSARNVAMARNKRGDAYVEKKRFAEAMADYEAALAIFRKLHAGDPTQSEHERDIGLSNHRMGIAQLMAGEPAKATPYFDAEVEIMRRRWQASPTKSWSRRDLAVALEDRVDAPASPAQLCAWRREFDGLLRALKADGSSTSADQEALDRNVAKLKECPPTSG